MPRPPTLLVPGPFTLFASYENNKYYPEQQTWDLLNPRPRLFKGIKDIDPLDNPYLPKNLLGEERNLLAKIDQKYGVKQVRAPATAQECTFTAMTRRMLGATMRINLNSYRFLTDNEPHPPTGVNIKKISKVNK